MAESGPANGSNTKEGRSLTKYGFVVALIVIVGLGGLVWREAINPIPPHPTPTVTASPIPS